MYHGFDGKISIILTIKWVYGKLIYLGSWRWNKSTIDHPSEIVLYNFTWIYYQLIREMEWLKRKVAGNCCQMLGCFIQDGSYELVEQVISWPSLMLSGTKWLPCHDLCWHFNCTTNDHFYSENSGMQASPQFMTPPDSAGTAATSNS